MTKGLSRIVFFGDSICVGQGVSLHKGWVARIAAWVEQKSTGCYPTPVVVNASVNGNTTRQALERMPYEVQAHGVGLMLVQFGMNDCNYWQTDNGVPRVSRRAFTANLAEIIQRGLNFGARRILLNTNHCTVLDKTPFKDQTLTYEASNRSYNEAIREVAAEFPKDVILNDMERHFLDAVGDSRTRLQDLLLDDGLHLSTDGHTLYYKKVLETFEPVFREHLMKLRGMETV